MYISVKRAYTGPTITEKQMYTFKVETVSGKTYAAGRFTDISKFGETERYTILDAMSEQSTNVFKTHALCIIFVILIKLTMKLFG